MNHFPAGLKSRVEILAWHSLLNVGDQTSSYHPRINFGSTSRIRELGAKLIQL